MESPLDDDQARMDYIRKHIKIVRKAVKKGIPLKGYFYWTLLDNYEWLEGKAARFGLIAVDYDKDYQRSPRDSARYFARLVSEQNI
jgi:beta-glucosidase